MTGIKCMEKLSLVSLLLLAALTAHSQEPEQAEAKKRKATSRELYETIARTDGAVLDALKEKKSNG